MITPPRELVEQWQDESPEAQIADHIQYLVTRAAQWGADQGLDASGLRAARRPKPSLSLKEQALTQLDEILKNPQSPLRSDTDIIRRALNQLPDD